MNCLPKRLIFIKTDNSNLDNIVEKLELIYTKVNWPFVNASLGTYASLIKI